MSQSATTQAASPNTDGRTANGQFAKGNKGGPGNPFARKVAALRAALINSVTEEDIQDISCVLMLHAKGGDKQCAKLLFQYLIGKPQPAVNPDQLDADELNGLLNNRVHLETINTIDHYAPLSFALELFRTKAAYLSAQLHNSVHDELVNMNEELSRWTPGSAECAPPPGFRPEDKAKGAPPEKEARQQTAESGKPKPRASKGRFVGEDASLDARERLQAFVKGQVNPAGGSKKS